MELLTVKQTAEILNVSVGTVRNLLKRGELPSLRVGSQIRFVRDELEKWVMERVGADRRLPGEGRGRSSRRFTVRNVVDTVPRIGAGHVR